MKMRFLSLIMMIGMTLVANASVEHLLPKPQQISTSSSTFNLSRPIRLITPSIGTNDPAISAELTNLITTNGGNISGTSIDSIEVKLVASVAGAEFQNEAYSIQVTDKKVTITAKTLQGAYWATQTLWQLSENGNGNLQGCTITDWAAFHVRGYMLDIGRSYMDFEEVKKEIANLARYKVNVFHWHLTENQGWRLESKKYPQLNASANYTRHPGKYYSMAQARELVQWCSKHGVLLIPEIDVPGHSEAFTRAFGFNMQTTQGLVIVKELMAEAIDSCFSTSPILHIGTDEVSMTMANFVPDIVTLIRSKGLKVGTWKRGYGSYNVADLGIVNVWAGGTAPLAGAPNVDCRYHYLNHFDQFSDVVGMYNSSILEVAKETTDRVGVVMAIWNDRLTRSDRDIVIQNALYPAALAIAERAWMGGGTYITTKGVVMDNPGTTGYNNFADWERRFLFQKANFLKNEPIAYVKQSNIQWRITDAYPNSGTLTTSFPHETTQTDSTIASSCTYNGTSYNSKKVNGAGIYLRHTWGTGVPAFYSNPQTNSTAYAYTWVYSPKAQTVGAIIEFQNYGRSESDVPARQGKWDYKESQIWVNNQEILAPTWESQHTSRNNETALTNENFSARNPISVNLNKGWNKVFMKLPVGAFSISQVRLVKWSFTFAFVTTDGKDAVDGLVYSPDKNLNNPSLDILINAIDNAYASKTSMSANSGTDPGQYDNSVTTAFIQKIAEATAIRNNSTLSDAIYLAAADSLNAQTTRYNAMVSLPKASTAQTEYWYSFTTPLRNSNTYNCVAYQGDNADLKGETFVSNTPKLLWKLTKNNDGSYNIISKVSGSYISPNSSNNTALKAQTGTPTAGGWTFTPIYINNYFVVVSGSVQFNQTNSGLSYKIYNWGSGTNTTDTGCQFVIKTEQTVNLTSALENDYDNPIFAWTENRILKYRGCAEKPQMFSIDGRELNIAQRISNDIVLIRMGNKVVKLIVH